MQIKIKCLLSVSGQFGCSHYFIISGTVVVEVSTKEETGSAVESSKPVLF